MFQPFRPIVASLVALSTLGAALAAQQPRILNGRVASQAAGTPFAPSFRSLVAAQTDTAWIGYSVPTVDGERTMCCGSNRGWVDGSVGSSGRGCCNACALEPSSTRTPAVAIGAPTPAAPIKLESGGRMVVLFRVEAQQIERIRVFSEDCELDAGGRSVLWLDAVRPADSVALLESLAASAPAERAGTRLQDAAISAIAGHGDTAADASLERLLATSQPPSARKKVTFWLGNARGQRGLELLQRVLRDDPSAEVRKGAVFGLAQVRNDGGVPTLIQTARDAKEPALRGEAIFWLGQKAGQKAAAAITERIEQDPDTEVKKKAVFALSQIPKDEGVPLLINVARTNANPAVRKQAMFWLGQSKDPRAVEFFAEILK